MPELRLSHLGLGSGSSASRPPRSHQSKSSDGRPTVGEGGSHHSSSSFVGETEEQEVLSPLKQRDGAPSADKEKSLYVELKEIS